MAAPQLKLTSRSTTVSSNAQRHMIEDDDRIVRAPTGRFAFGNRGAVFAMRHRPSLNRTT